MRNLNVFKLRSRVEAEHSRHLFKSESLQRQTQEVKGQTWTRTPGWCSNPPEPEPDPDPFLRPQVRSGSSSSEEATWKARSQKVWRKHPKVWFQESSWTLVWTGSNRVRSDWMGGTRTEPWTAELPGLQIKTQTPGDFSSTLKRSEQKTNWSDIIPDGSWNCSDWKNHFNKNSQQINN